MLTEELALSDEIDGQIHRFLGHGQVLHGIDQPLFRQPLHQVVHTLRRITQHVVPGNPDIVEEQLRRILGLHAQFFQVAATFEAVHAALHDKQTQLPGIVGRIRFRGHNHRVGIDAVGDVGLAAVEQVVIPVVHGRGAHPPQVAAGIRLRHADGENALAADAFRQETVLLFLVAETGEIGSHQAAVETGEEIRRQGRGVFLDDDLLEAKIRVPHTAERLVGPDHEKPQLPRLAECGAVDDAGLPPLLHMRNDFLLEKLAVGRAKQALLFGEASLEHHRSPVQWRADLAIVRRTTRPSPACPPRSAVL